MSLSDICYVHIKNNYCYGAYGEFKVVMMKDCTQVNATKLCSQGSKNFYDWKRLKGAKQLFKVFETKISLPVIPSSTGDPRLRVSAIEICGI